MSRLTRDRTAEPVSRDQILRHVRGQGNNNFACSADHEQDWQPYLVDPYSAICDDHTYSRFTDLSDPPDHVSNWQPRMLPGKVEVRSVKCGEVHEFGRLPEGPLT